MDPEEDTDGCIIDLPEYMINVILSSQKAFKSIQIMLAEIMDQSYKASDDKEDEK